MPIGSGLLFVSPHLLIAVMPFRLFAFAGSLLFTLSASLGAVAQSIVLPDMGDFSRQYLSTSEEQDLGAAVLQELRDRGMIIEDVQLDEYLASVGQSLATYGERHGNPYRFYWLQNPTINAFATPGSFIGVNSGLLLATQTEDELAGVLAHEIAHVSQSHVVSGMVNAQRLSLPMMAALLASMAVAAVDARVGQAAVAITQAAGIQQQINFTRAHEQEADRIGAQILSKAGYDPNGMADFFTRLDRLPGGLEAQIPEFLRTHPLPRNRRADIEGRYPEQPDRRAARRDGAAYHLAKARAQVLTTGDVSALIRVYETTLSKGGSQKTETAERYGYALALKKAGRYQEAQQQIERLRKLEPDRLAFRIEEAELALARGDPDQAWRLFEDARKLYTDDFTLVIHYGQALVAQGDARKAAQLLQPYLQRRSDVPALYAVYAQASQRSGDMAAAYGAMAEHSYMNGKLLQAIRQLELGLRSSGITAYQTAKLQARLREFNEEKRKLEKVSRVTE